MIEFMKLMVTVLAMVVALALGMGVLALALMIIEELGEKYVWVYPVVGISTIVLIATTVLYISGARAPW